jgi:RHS repeat-associated protein
MVCRSTSTTLAQSCYNGNAGGAQLRYDNEGRLVAWQDAPSSPTTTVSDAYDGAGQRVAQRVTVSGSTTTTYYLAGGLAEQTQSQPGGVLTNYYTVPGVCSAVSVGSTLSYLATDGLGSMSAALSSTTASVTAQQLYGPYGNVRYASGSMPTAKGYTGQYADAATGLDYYGARYYDPLAQQFVSADSVLPGQGYDPWGLSRYAYVAGNPATATDPTGHYRCDETGCSRGHHNHGRGGCTYDCGGGGGCQSNCNGEGGGGNGGCHSDASCGCYTTCGPSAPCTGQARNLCAAIDATFTGDSKDEQSLRSFLYELTMNTVGLAFLAFVMFMTHRLGSSYITLAHLGYGNGDVGLSSAGGFITLNLDNIGSVATGAATIIHEAVESYFASVLGIRQMATLHADYVAEQYQGLFLYLESGVNRYGGASGYGSFGETFDTWVSSRGSSYAGEFRDVIPGDVLDRGDAWTLAGTAVFVGDAPDPVGLAPWMLQTNDL